MNFYKHTLANGLTLIGEYNETAVSSAVGFFVRTGARDEYPGVEGVSHFLEHMLFKGTETRSALDITYQMGAIGAQANAFTSEENTVYYMAVLPEYLSSALDLLSDMMRSVLDVNEFDMEKKVILEEIALYQDRPTFMLFESAMREYFSGHAAGNSVLGSIESITALERDQMKLYFDKRYVPSNMVFTISGSFDWDFVVSEIERHCGNWQDTSVSRDIVPHTPVEVDKTMYKADMQRAHVCLVAPGPSAQEEERYPASLLSCILGDSTGSRTYWELVDNGLADAVSIDIDEMDSTGMIYAYASCSPENIEQVEEVLRGVLDDAANFDSDMYNRAVTKLATRLVLQGESSMKRLMTIGMDWIYREQYCSLHKELETLKAVSRQDVVGVLSRYNFRPTCAVRLLPEQ